MTAHTDLLTALPIAPALLDRTVRGSIDTRTHEVRAAEHTGRPPLVRRERILAQHRDAHGAAVVATTLAFCHRDRQAPDGWARLVWEEIGRVRLDPGGTLELSSLRTDPPYRLVLEPATGARVAAVVRDRVAATVVASSRVPLDDRASALVTARRRPGTAELVWVVVLPDGADAADRGIATRVDAAIHDLRCSF
jgi:hypothetical protein